MKKFLHLVTNTLIVALFLSSCSLNNPQLAVTATPTRTPEASAPTVTPATSAITNTTGVTGTAGITSTPSTTTTTVVTGSAVLTSTAVPTATPPVTTASTPTATAVITVAPGTADVFRTISTIPGLETINSALIATALVNELDVTTRTFTIFAPTNQAFLALSARQRENIMTNPVLLRNILRYHVVVDRVTQADLARIGGALTALGENVVITNTASGQVKVNNATITQANISASNGLIHVIDSVLIPPSLITATNTVTGTGTITGASAATNNITATGTVTTEQAMTTTGTATTTRIVTINVSGLTIAQVISETPELRTLGVALQAGGMVTSLQGTGPVTVFAPTNQAFAALSAGTLQNLLNTPTTLVNVLQYHVVADRVTAADLARLGIALSVQGQSMTVTVQPNGAELINNATIIQRDIVASNGIIHIINGVLTPPSE